LARLDDIELVLSYASWIFTKSAEEGIKIFLSSKRESGLPPDRVLEFLSSYGGNYRQQYLEHIIFNEKNETEKYHTKLALLYLKVVLDLLASSSFFTNKFKPGEEPGLLGPVRKKLLTFLEWSSQYNVATLLQRVRDTLLHDECVILYSRIGQHHKALMVLVEQMKDFQRAEQYCMINSNKDQDLFISLLQVYLSSPPSSSFENTTTTASSSVPEIAIRLLNRYPTYFNPVNVLPLLPPNLPLYPLLRYLTASMQHSHHEERDGMVVKNLNKLQNLQVSCQLVQNRDKAVLIDRDSKCKVCKKRIGDKVFALYPNGVYVHFKCFTNKHVCPITNVDFRTRHTTY